MNKKLLGLNVLTLLLAACGSQAPLSPVTNAPTSPSPRTADQPARTPTFLGSVDLPISTQGFISGQSLTFREGDVSFTQLSAATVQSDASYDYIRAQFQLKNNGTTAFNNLSLVAVAKSGNVGDTAIKTITSLGGTASADQATVTAKIIPTHSLTVGTGGALTLVSGAEDFQAYTPSEVSGLTSQAGWSTTYAAGDTPLNYGFVARACTVSGTTCTPSSTRTIAANGGTGMVNVAVRIPKGTSTTYNFVMNFAFVDQDVSRATVSNVATTPADTASAASGRLTALGVASGSGEIMTIGTPVSTSTAGRTDVNVSDLSSTSTQANSVWDTGVWDTAVWR